MSRLVLPNGSNIQKPSIDLPPMDIDLAPILESGQVHVAVAIQTLRTLQKLTQLLTDTRESNIEPPQG